MHICRAIGIGIHQLKEISTQETIYATNMDQDLTYLGFYRVLSSSTTYRWVQNQLKIIHRTTLVCEDGPHLGNTEVQYLVVDLASGRTEATYTVIVS